MSRYYPCPECGKEYVSAEYLKAHTEKVHPDYVEGVVKRKGWATPYGFCDFTHPVTYDEALATMKQAAAEIAWPEQEKE